MSGQVQNLLASPPIVHLIGGWVALEQREKTLFPTGMELLSSGRTIRSLVIILTEVMILKLRIKLV
jgi:hypothetical protein